MDECAYRGWMGFQYYTYKLCKALRFYIDNHVQGGEGGE